MRKSLFTVLGTAAALGAALLTTTAASAAPQARAGPAAADPDTTITFTVTTGSLAMTAPATADLGSGAPGTTISANLGTPPAGNVVVTDNRALLAAAWTATAIATDWTTGAGTPAETIPATDVGYNPGTITTTGTITATGTTLTSLALTAVPATVVAGTSGVGDNSATWDPTIAVRVPASAVGGAYGSTLTQSVS